jgi:uncharacterized protein (DUF169 family)
MTDYRNLESQFTKALSLRTRPVAVRFHSAPPVNVIKFTGTEPSGCSFWRVAAGGRTFYTVPADHYNCPIGSYTHNISLPPDRAKELDQTLGLMTQIGYLKTEEVPGIPRLAAEPAAIIYSPLAEAPFAPDVIIFSGSPARMMLLQEAAIRAGRAAQLPVLGRPTCMSLPAAIGNGAVMSTACIGNRIYTGLNDSELYVTIRGKDLESIADELSTTVNGNSHLAAYHSERRAQLSTE